MNKREPREPKIVIVPVGMIPAGSLFAARLMGMSVHARICEAVRAQRPMSASERQARMPGIAQRAVEGLMNANRLN